MALAYDGHKVSAHHKFANGTYFISSALVLKFSAFFLVPVSFNQQQPLIFRLVKHAKSMTNFSSSPFGISCKVFEYTMSTQKFSDRIFSAGNVYLWFSYLRCRAPCTFQKT